ncbi:MAG: hypothetical protein ACE5IC_08555 [Candidatus Brocadiales bacterium]
MATKSYKDKMVHSSKTTKKTAHKGSSKSVTDGKARPTMAGKK